MVVISQKQLNEMMHNMKEICSQANEEFKKDEVDISKIKTKLTQLHSSLFTIEVLTRGE